MTPEQIRELRAKAMAIAVSLCQGRKDEYDDAYDAYTICTQAERIFNFLAGEKWAV